MLGSTLGKLKNEAKVSDGRFMDVTILAGKCYRGWKEGDYKVRFNPQTKRKEKI